MNNYKIFFHKILLDQSLDLLYIMIDFDLNKNMFEINKMMVTIEDYLMMILMIIIMYLMEVLHEYLLLMILLSFADIEMIRRKYRINIVIELNDVGHKCIYELVPFSFCSEEEEKK